MDQNTRDIITQKLGTLMLANAELASVNNTLASEVGNLQAAGKILDAEVATLKARIAFLETCASEKASKCIDHEGDARN